MPRRRDPSTCLRRSLVAKALAAAAALAPVTWLACGTAASTTVTNVDAGGDGGSGAREAGCGPSGSVPGCPCNVATPGTVLRVGQIACASGTGPAAVACGQRSEDGGVTFKGIDASAWVPFFTCPGKDTCSAVTTYDELTCSDPATGAITYYAILGAPCFHPSEGACSLDLGTVMECESGVWTAFASCPTHTCLQQGDHPACGPAK